MDLIFRLLRRVSSAARHEKTDCREKRCPYDDDFFIVLLLLISWDTMEEFYACQKGFIQHASWIFPLYDRDHSNTSCFVFIL